MVRGRQVASLTDSIRDAVAGVNADLAVAGLHSFSDDYDRAVGPQRFALLLAGVIAGAAVLLSAIGIYGVLMLETHSRYREIGIRMAVGARAEQVNRMILGSGLRLAALGIGLGVPAGPRIRHARQRRALRRRATRPADVRAGGDRGGRDGNGSSSAAGEARHPS